MSPYLLKLYKHAQANNSLPPTLTEAVITVIHKKGKDPQEASAYRPISLLNVDGKLFAKILANRLNPLLGKLVHIDQTGFIPNRNSTFNLRRLFNIIYTKRGPPTDLTILALDAEKAFDQIEWYYLFEALNRFNLGDKFLSLIKLIYKNPTAQILTNRTISAQFGLQRGTRQGCPLSPLIFALAIEPLAQCIRLNPLIHGYNTNGTTNKISLYADDILLYITQPQITIPALLDTINLFGTFSGYRINWNKSVLMPVHTNNLALLESFPFKISRDKFTYLGIEITRHYSSLFQANFTPLIETLRTKIQFWDTLPISLIGRINAIKMIFLPQLIYLFQNIPVLVKKSFFKKLDSLIVPFLWGHKAHRIGKKHICRSKLEGGLALPDFMLYYWAAVIRSFTYWLDTSTPSSNWLKMEQEDCHPFSIGAILLAPTKIDKLSYNNNPIIYSMIRIWKQIQFNFKLSPVSPALPIDKNPTFAPSNQDGAFSKWSEKGIHCVGDLYIEGVFASFKQLQKKYGLGHNNFFRYLQIRDYIRKHLKDFETETKSPIDNCLKLSSNENKLISHIYNNLLSISSPSPDNHKRKWEEEFGKPVPDDLWKKSLENIHTCSNNARHCLIQFKIIHRLHYSKEKLHKIYPEVSPICDKCQSSVATLLHSFVLCPKIQSFWVGVCGAMSEIMDTRIKPEPLLIILGISDDSRNLNTTQQRFLSYCLITAKKLILTLWKSATVPTFKMWLEDLTNTLHLERIRYALKDRLQLFNKTWKPLILYLAAVNPAQQSLVQHTTHYLNN